MDQKGVAEREQLINENRRSKKITSEGGLEGDEKGSARVRKKGKERSGHCCLLCPTSSCCR